MVDEKCKVVSHEETGPGYRYLVLEAPKMAAELQPGQWQKTPDGRDVLITYSPAYILRFGTVTPAVQKIKQDMWLSLKAVRQRLSIS